MTDGVVTTPVKRVMCCQVLFAVEAQASKGYFLLPCFPQNASFLHQVLKSVDDDIRNIDFVRDQAGRIRQRARNTFFVF